jgi:hypothetical protein
MPKFNSEQILIPKFDIGQRALIPKTNAGQNQNRCNRKIEEQKNKKIDNLGVST